MENITISDVRRAITYVNMGGQHIDILRDVTDEELLAKDFTKDFNMGNIRVANVLIELERIHNFNIPMDIFKMTADNTVGAFLIAVNQHIKNFLRPDEVFKVRPD